MADSPLPPLPAWQARSFWLTLTGAALQIAALAHVDVLGFLGVEGQDQLVDVIMQAVAVVAFVWAWFERRQPQKQLSFAALPKAAPPPTADEIRRRKRAHRDSKVESFAKVEFSTLIRDGKTGRPKIDRDPNRSPELKAALRAQLTPAELAEYGDLLK